MHDIRTPLQSVVTALHLLENVPVDSPKRLSRLENLASMCRDNIPLVGEIIETTLDMSREIHISPKDGNIVESIQSAITANRSICSLRKADVRYQGPDFVNAYHDSTQVTRVVANLVKNGIEAVDPKIANPELIVSIQEDQTAGIIISVEDNGSGISGNPERIFRVFESSKIHGTGLGLHISKKIIEAHRGSINASNGSSLGGAKFDVILPADGGVL